MKKKNPNAKRNSIKAHKEIIGPSENIIKKWLGRKHNPARFLHGGNGYPDWIIIDGKKKVYFYEIKPANGTISKMIPTEKQKEVFKEVMRKFKTHISVLYYSKNKVKKFHYDEYKINSLKDLRKLVNMRNPREIRKELKNPNFKQ